MESANVLKVKFLFLNRKDILMILVIKIVNNVTLFVYNVLNNQITAHSINNWLESVLINLN